jgi:hypothetical protein
VLFVGMLELRGVYNTIVGPKEGEADGDGSGGAKRGAEGNVDGLCLKLEAGSQRRECLGLSNGGITKDIPRNQRGWLTILAECRQRTSPPSGGQIVLRPCWRRGENMMPQWASNEGCGQGSRLVARAERTVVSHFLFPSVAGVDFVWRVSRVRCRQTKEGTSRSCLWQSWTLQVRHKGCTNMKNYRPCRSWTRRDASQRVT